MRLELLEELLARRAARLEERGEDFPQALRRAGEELLAALEGRLNRADLFCSRLCIRAADRTLRAQRLGEVLGSLARCRVLPRPVETEAEPAPDHTRVALRNCLSPRTKNKNNYF